MVTGTCPGRGLSVPAKSKAIGKRFMEHCQAVVVHTHPVYSRSLVPVPLRP